ncbi:uncharacterized protein SPPG_05227 [Spizellomyces punctatus DAOM BR117]|uniref:Uncharacterized protein n=1 Tax=Spizellomyces punctatus (strain DAOM BR117) TaxID=645134 RepID=A0A0L0HFZ5_SPIPD|nr:uncharacterized protein SPPG_05227 [Spizellomyces punctatus DAOM BR117]KNC99854.1 hypothetical protein SPPG_05227 [Spizellomyces punctatus DAOM BR117]|eukprot:XP_016607894.1 hypothetical protein SPPG_05227 [Spizellomyces punctatus DAOM BR117]
MKFGRTLVKYQVPEWSAQYIAYKSLKRAIKHAKRLLDVKGPKDSETEEAITAFIKMVEIEAKKINGFWSNQYSATERRLRLSKEQLEQKDVRSIPNDEVVETINEIKVQLYLVLRYLEMNRTGFRKILKKFDKKLDVELSEKLWAEKVAVYPFCTDTSLENMLQVVDDLSEKAQSIQHSLWDDAQATPSPDIHYAFPAEVQAALKADDVTLLSIVMEKIRSPAPGQALSTAEEKRTYCSILVKACQRNALKCIAHLVQQPDLVSTPLPGDINQRTILHRLAVLGPNLLRQPGGGMVPSSGIGRDDPTLLQYILSHIPSNVANSALRVKDFLGRTPLHYTALYGMPSTAKVLLNFLSDGILKGSQWVDDDGHSPLFYAVVRGFVDVLLVLLPRWNNVDELGDAFQDTDLVEHRQLQSYVAGQQINPGESVLSSPLITPSQSMAALMDIPLQPTRTNPSTPLALACTFGHAEVVRVLLEHGANSNVCNDDGESPLHLCARGGHIVCVRLLLGQVDGATWAKANCDSKDRSFGRTPLFLAAMEGHIECVKALLDAGASVQIVDSAGLNPHEYAVFRAHNEVAAILRSHVTPYTVKPANIEISSVAQAVVVERAYGHRYLKGQSMIRLYLGSLDLRRRDPPVRLDDKRIPAQMAPGTFRLTISAKNAVGDPAIFDLPLLEPVPEPIVFYAENFEQVSLQFDIHPAYGEATKKARLIGRASALLSTVKTSLWQEKTPLGGSVDVPIMSSHSLEIIGSVTFEFVVVKPFVHGNLKGDGARTWRSQMTKVVGHRGLGMNKAAHVANGRGHLQLGENTLLSFITAGALGAEYVEFDVQLTKDLVPVLYHDFRVWETGYHLPLSALTVEEFLALRPKERPSRKLAWATNGHLRRTMSMSDASEESLKAADERASWPTRGNDDGSVQLPFATLEETLKKVPTKIGFNVEVKYPNLQEAEQDELQNAEINVFCDKILEGIFDNAGDRNIYFSSFHPEVCWMLSMKQNHYPVFFLTEGGTDTTYDARCNSLLDAVRFATRAGCLGIVTKVDPILEAPGLIRAIRESGLLLFTYGGLNNEVENAKLQRSYGVDAIIVDKVRSVFTEFQKV